MLLRRFWSKTGGQTNVYEASVTPEWGADNWLNAFEDDAFLARAANLGACDSTPGSYFPSAASGTITLYIHPNGSTDPTSDGKTYEYTHRYTALECWSYAGCFAAGIETRKPLSTRGCLVMGKFGTAQDCVANHGNSHNIFYREGCTIRSCSAAEGYYGASDSILFIGHDDPTGEKINVIDCTASMAVYRLGVDGFGCHKNSTGSFGTVTYTRCTVVNCESGFTGADATFVLEDITITNCYRGIIAGTDASGWTIDGLTVTGACFRAVEIQTTVAVVSVNNADIDVDCNNTRLFYLLSNATLTVTNSNLRGDSFAGTNRHFYISQAGATLNCSGNVYGDGFAHIYYCPNIGSLTSDNNCFDDGTEAFNLGGSNYASVALWQAGTGQDAASSIGGCVA